APLSRDGRLPPASTVGPALGEKEGRQLTSPTRPHSGPWQSCALGWRRGFQHSLALRESTLSLSGCAIARGGRGRQWQTLATSLVTTTKANEMPRRSHDIS